MEELLVVAKNFPILLNGKIKKQGRKTEFAL